MSELKYEWAYDEDWNWVPIENAVKGKIYMHPFGEDWIELIVKEGDVNVKHFASTSGFDHPKETIVHENKKYQLKVQLLSYGYELDECVLRPAKVIVEKYNENKVKPDITLYDSEGNFMLFIEVVVTHKSDKRKIHKLTQAGLLTLELYYDRTSEYIGHKWIGNKEAQCLTVFRSRITATDRQRYGKLTEIGEFQAERIARIDNERNPIESRIESHGMAVERIRKAIPNPGEHIGERIMGLKAEIESITNQIRESEVRVRTYTEECDKAEAEVRRITSQIESAGFEGREADGEVLKRVRAPYLKSGSEITQTQFNLRGIRVG